MRRITILPSAALTAALVLAPVAAGAQNIGVDVNGQPVRFMGTQPMQVNGRVLVPLRGVLEQMGATVDYNPTTRTVIANQGSHEIILPVGSRQATVDGNTVMLDVPAMTYAGTTMVPLRFVGQALGADVTWNAANQLVMIDTAGSIPRDNEYHPAVAQNNGYQRPANRDYGYPPPVSPSNGYQPPINQNNGYQQPVGRAHRTYGYRTLTLPQGTVIPVVLNDSLSSLTSRPGDHFTAAIRSGSDNPGIPDGTRIEGVVREATPSSGRQPGVLDVDFVRMVFPNGDSMPIAANVVDLNSKSIQRTADGRLTSSDTNRNNERNKFIGIGAAGGLVIGALTKNNAILSTILGAGLGYLYGQTQNNQPRDVRLGSGQEFGIRLDRQLSMRVPDTSDNSGLYYNGR